MQAATAGFVLENAPLTSQLRPNPSAARLDRSRKRITSSHGASARPRSRVLAGAPQAATRIRLSELRPRDIEAWQQLAACAAEPNPFFEPECVLSAARHVTGADGDLLVVRNAARDWLGCLPITPWLGLGRARVPVVSTWRHPYVFLGTPLVAESDVEWASERLLEGLLGASHLGAVALSRLGDDGPVATALFAALVERRGRPVLHRASSRAVMRRATLVEGVDALMSSRHRRDLRRLARRLAEELGGPLVMRDVSDDPTAVEHFMALEAAGWKGERGSAIQSRVGHQAFFRELCTGFRAGDRLQLLAFGTHERIVSYKCNLLARDAVFCFKIAYDEALRQYRPGLQLELRMLALFRDDMGQGWMDSCADPDSAQFNRLWPDRRPIGNYILTGPDSAGPVIGWGAARLSAASRRRVSVSDRNIEQLPLPRP